MRPSLLKRFIVPLTSQPTACVSSSKLVPPQGKQFSLRVDFAALNEASNGPEVPTRVSDGVFAA
jgi:hypothetical protein